MVWFSTGIYIQGPRILFREIISDRFICSAIEEDFIIDRSLYIAKPKDSEINIYNILAILYSKLVIWVFKYSRNEFDDLFPKIRLDEFKKLPIPNKESLSKSLSVKIKQLMSMYQKNEVNSIVELEKELDLEVYKEFGLYESDINIIESTYR